MINLFFIIHDYSGARTYGNELLDYLNGIDGFVLHKVFFESNHYKEYTVIRECNITEIHFPPAKKTNYSIEKYSNRCLDLMSSLLEGKENIIFHLNFAKQVKLGIKARERFGARLLYTLHFLPDYFSYNAYDFNWIDKLETVGDDLEKEMIFEADKIICVTKFAKEAICKHYETPIDKVEAIHNGFSNIHNYSNSHGESKAEIRKEFGFGKNEMIILFVGVMEPRKGIKYIIRAFTNLTVNFSNVRLVIAGSGSFNETLSYIDKSWAKITFTGKIPYNNLERLYKITTVGVIPSVYEQCSYVALEMMKHGLPVVVAAAPGLRELYYNDKNALVVPLHKIENTKLKLELNEEKLTDAIAKLLKEKALQKKISRNARFAWQQLYTASHMGESTLTQYKLLIK